MTIDDIKAAVDAGKTVHWAHEGYVVHKDQTGQYLITFKANGSTVGLTNRANTNLNGQSQLFFVSRPDLGITMHCQTCQSAEVQTASWAAWNPELQVWEADQIEDKAYCNACHSETHLISRPVREFGVGKSVSVANQSEPMRTTSKAG